MTHSERLRDLELKSSVTYKIHIITSVLEILNTYGIRYRFYHINLFIIIIKSVVNFNYPAKTEKIFDSKRQLLHFVIKKESDGKRKEKKEKKHVKKILPNPTQKV